MYVYDFTVFTPTFNRCYTLPAVYESLKAQTFTNFEWLIVDDGSIDDTQELVSGWIAESGVPIRYVYQENQGKHRAFNRGVKEARGALFLTLDSDDTCVPTALERFKYHWDSIPEEDREQFSAVTALCMNQRGDIVGNPFPHNILDSDPIEIRVKYKVTGEKWGFQRTDILSRFPFPEFPGELFIPESVVWNRIASRYKTRYINEPLRTYEVLPDSLSTASVRIRAMSPRGARLYYQEYLALTSGSLNKARAIVNYVRFSLHGEVRLADVIAGSKHPFATIVLGAAGYVRYVLDVRGMSRNAHAKTMEGPSLV
jgi:glycosyltransferase involved in cell wall biosynthesis